VGYELLKKLPGVALLVPLLLPACFLSPVSLQAAPVKCFKIYLEDSGVYSVTYADLLGKGLPEGNYDIKEISLRNRGRQRPFWVDGGDASRFGPGSRIVFVGERLRGEYSYLDEYSAYNCYFLCFGAGEGMSARDLSAHTADGSPGRVIGMKVHHHMEEDVVMVRLHEHPGHPEERWYWARMAVTDKKPFQVKLNLDHLRIEKPDAASLRSVHAVGPGAAELDTRLDEIYNPQPRPVDLKLRFAFRGWSALRKKFDGMADHRVVVRAGGKKVGVLEWNGQEPEIEEILVPGDTVVDGTLKIELQVDRRKEPDTGNLFVDVVLFNWLEVEYPRSPDFENGQSGFEIDNNDGKVGLLALELPTGENGRLYVDSGRRIELKPGVQELLLPTDHAERLFVVVGEGTRPPVRLVEDRPSRLRVRDRQADYIIVTHKSLKDAVEHLAAYHRKQGLSVAVVDVEDIFDEFHGGIPNPKSLQDFFSWVYHNWQSPRCRFVLLAGDASWDWKNSKVSDANYADWTYRPGEVWNFVKNGSTPYAEEASVNHRNLVPTWGFRSREGHAASDNWLVCVDGDDYYPDFAVGRIPVASPEEMKAVVAKTISYDSNAPEGDWRKRILFITNESKGFQRSSDQSGEFFAEQGFSVEKVYPDAKETANDMHTRRMLDLFDQGLLMVQFLGHGGRYIWRTGPPDLKKNHDLFTLEDLDQLQENRKLPFVISLTCYSAPFDHPTADSIGEKFLRLPQRGAIAVFAASWRNSPSSTMGRIVMEEATRPGATIGEAIMKAKSRLRNEILVQTYNLLGDPALHLAVPDEMAAPVTADHVEE